MAGYVATVISVEARNEEFWQQCDQFFEPFGIKETKWLSQGRVRDYVLNTQECDRLKEKAREFEPSGVDIVVQKSEATRKEKKLVVFDMDSTLIQQEVIDMIAAHGGIEPEVAAITESAMRGEIDFTESLKQRVGLLKGIDSNVFEHLKSKITFTPGARELCQVLKARGYKLVVLSGGFIPLAQYVQAQLGLDYAYANNLQEANGKLTGETFGRIINSTAKADLLQEIASNEGIELPYTMAVGDGSNDLEMMAVAGYGVAFNAKPIVQLKAPGKINTPSLKYVLYILGLCDHDI